MRIQLRAAYIAMLASTSIVFMAGASAGTEPAKDPRGLIGPKATPSASARQPTPTPPATALNAADTLRYWNQVAIDTSGLDHTAVKTGENRVFGHQLGPGRSSRAMAIVHIAVFDAVNSIVGGYTSYTKIPKAKASTSVPAAIAVAAHGTLIWLYPSHRARLDRLLEAQLTRPPDPVNTYLGMEAGKRAADAIIALRRDDGTEPGDPKMGIDWITSDLPGHWRQDPISLSPVALGAHWGKVKPFVIRSPSQFRLPPPPAMDTLEYAQAFEEVKALGGDGVKTPTQRTADQTHIGIFWAYDGTPSLCAPPRLYNQVVREISKTSTSVIELARLFALVNVAMADGGVASWESKFHYDFWRPITGVREASEGSGPTGAGDANPLTVGDPSWTPLGAPASNLNGPNFTPPFPSYPSGHATFGGVLFEMLRNYYGTDRVAFTFTSDEFNGVTVGNDGKVRPYLPRSYTALSQAEEENGQSRIYLGIHWAFDKTEGIKQGHEVADYVFANSFLPAR